MVEPRHLSQAMEFAMDEEIMLRKNTDTLNPREEWSGHDVRKFMITVSIETNYCILIHE